ncbi:MoaD family protein [Thermococcus sp.]
MKVRFYATFRSLIRKKEIEVHDIRTVKELIDYLSEKYSPQIKRELLQRGRKEVDGIILVNGHNILHLNGLETELKDEDVVHVFPPAGGG